MAVHALSLVAVYSVLVHEAPAQSDKADVVSQAFDSRMNGEYDAARAALEAEVKKSPKNARAWCELARLRFHMFGKAKSLDSARNAIEKAVESSPETAVYHCWAARIAVYNGIIKAHGDNKEEIARQFKRAGEAAEKALELDPDMHAARGILVSLYGNSPPEFGGNRELAEKQVKELEKRSPVDGGKARCELSLRDDQERRLALWRELGGNSAGDPRFHRSIALEYARAGDVGNAEKHADKALALDPTHGEILMDLTRAFGLKKEFDPAKKFAGCYLAHKPPGPLSFRAWTTFALAKIQKMDGDEEAADKTLEQARKLDSHLWFTMTPPPEELFEPPPPAAPSSDARREPPQSRP